MSAGKLLKIIDNELVRISDSPGEDILAIPDSFRHFTKRYYHNLVEKRTRGDIVVVKSAKRLIYGNNPPENVGAPNRNLPTNKWRTYQMMEELGIPTLGSLKYIFQRLEKDVHLIFMKKFNQLEWSETNHFLEAMNTGDTLF